MRTTRGRRRFLHACKIELLRWRSYCCILLTSDQGRAGGGPCVTVAASLRLCQDITFLHSKQFMAQHWARMHCTHGGCQHQQYLPESCRGGPRQALPTS